MPNGIVITVGGTWDGIQLPKLNMVSPTLSNSTEGIEQDSPAQDIMVVAGLAASAVGVGSLARLRRNEKTTVKEALLDAMTGAQLGSCLVASPEAEAICTGTLAALPMQVINKRLDKTWDFRVGLASHGVATLVDAELGIVPVPFAGYDTIDGITRLDNSELVANAAIDVGVKAGLFALSNTAAALVQKKKVPKFAIAGAAYGASLQTAVNVALGAPMKVSGEIVKNALADLDAEANAPRVSDVLRFTTFRLGGIYERKAYYEATTIGRNVSIDHTMIDPLCIAHELIHRDQIAGRFVSTDARNGTGLLSFYAQYAVWARGGYEDNPYELDAYFYTGDGFEGAPARKVYGDLLAMPFLLSAFGLFSLPK